ncbi:MAG: ATP-dependent helicase RecG [Chloroflexota bacterium]|nr:ATP-dependent helicase RecG [Chloroflexota bacterium]
MPVADPTLAILDQGVKAVVAPGMAKNLDRLGIKTVRDLVFHFPRRYDDFTHQMTLREIAEKPPDGPIAATVEIVDLRVDPGFRRRVQRTVARLRDETGEGEAVWFGRRYIERRLAPGQTVALAGKVELRGWVPRFANPEFGAADDSALHAGRIVPVYRLTAGVTAPTLRARIREALDRAVLSQPEYLTPDVRGQLAERLVDISDALEWVHFPPDFADRDRALRRLAFDELLALQVGMIARKRQRETEDGVPITVADARFGGARKIIENVIADQVRARMAAAGSRDDELEISLTPDQSTALDDIRVDLAGRRPMMRLLQGDVGSGKTAVAALALAFTADAEHQGALLAPTDLLARQHAATLSRQLEPLGHEVVLLTGSLPAAQRSAALEALGAPTKTIEGRTRGLIVVGTHALVQEAVSFVDLRLVVVDEQHRFGVAEREALTSKGAAPHVLLMTATPIPRTLGQIVHADLDVSDLRTPPAGRRQIRTAIRRTDELVRRPDGRQGAIALICQQVAAGHRAFVVVPLVEEDEGSAGRSVEQAAELVRQHWPEAAQVAGVDLPVPTIEIVHGQMKAADRDARMERFRSGEVPIVVGTTVLEVGVDVPEATVMMVLDADRFGLAQLHQLRGRVGRGEAESYCVLVTERYPKDPQNPADDEEATVAARLDALVATTDGFVLAEKDLEQRREGELLGLSQSGMPPLRVASLSGKANQELSLQARTIAERIVDAGGRLPPEYAALEHELTVGWLARVGAGEVLTQDADA